MNTIKSSGFYEVTSNFFGTPFGMFLLGVAIGVIILTIWMERDNK